MKSLLSIAFLLFIINANAQTTPQSSPVQLMELVVEVPKLTLGKTFDTFKTKLHKVQSLKVEGFCDSQKLLYLRFSPEQYFNVLVAINETGYAYYIKKGVTLNKSIDECADKSTLYLRESSSVD